MSSAEKLFDVCKNENIKVKKAPAGRLDAFTKSSVNGGIAFKVQDEKYIALDETLSG